MRGLLIVLFCALLGIGVPLVSALAATPCPAMAMDSPCCDTGSDADCALACAAAPGAAIVAGYAADAFVGRAQYPGPGRWEAFCSHAGPPGLQPPR
jgi:hypothetical protein